VVSFLCALVGIAIPIGVLYVVAWKLGLIIGTRTKRLGRAWPLFATGLLSSGAGLVAAFREGPRSIWPYAAWFGVWALIVLGALLLLRRWLRARFPAQWPDMRSGDLPIDAWPPRAQDAVGFMALGIGTIWMIALLLAVGGLPPSR
jgi:hypothetical protein